MNDILRIIVVDENKKMKEASIRLFLKLIGEDNFKHLIITKDMQVLRNDRLEVKFLYKDQLIRGHKCDYFINNTIDSDYVRECLMPTLSSSK